MKLSKIKEIAPRTYWHNEATDFTPWLAEEDNLAELSEAIYLDLEVVSREERMDGGRADLLCVDTGTGKNVIIENQLEKTDPDHLGRILSYAAALNANTIIWIATEFDEQYRATIDWLNRVTDEDFNFFGIEIEVSNCGSMVRYRIGENGTVSEWKEIHYTKGGRPFFEVSKKAHGCTRYYLDEFMKI